MYTKKCCECKEEFSTDKIIYAPKTKVFYYFCDECYLARKNTTQELFDKYKSETKIMFEEKEVVHKINDFFRQFGFLDGRFYSSLKKIRIGQFSTKKYNKEFSITYYELLEMCEMLEDYLKKSFRSLKDTTGAIHYILAIVYNSYPKYHKWKKEQKLKKSESVEVVESVSHLVKKEDSPSEEKEVDLDDFLF